MLIQKCLNTTSELCAVFATVLLITITLNSALLNRCICLQYVSAQPPLPPASSIPFYSVNEIVRPPVVQYSRQSLSTDNNNRLNRDKHTPDAMRKRRYSDRSTMLNYNVLVLMVEKSAHNRFDLVHIGPAIDIAVDKCAADYGVGLNVNKGQ